MMIGCYYVSKSECVVDSYDIVKRSQSRVFDHQKTHVSGEEVKLMDQNLIQKLDVHIWFWNT